jgi:hypothetical protein
VALSVLTSSTSRMTRMPVDARGCLTRRHLDHHAFRASPSVVDVCRTNAVSRQTAAARGAPLDRDRLDLTGEDVRDLAEYTGLSLAVWRVVAERLHGHLAEQRGLALDLDAHFSLLCHVHRHDGRGTN